MARNASGLGPLPGPRPVILSNRDLLPNGIGSASVDCTGGRAKCISVAHDTGRDSGAERNAQASHAMPPGIDAREVTGFRWPSCTRSKAAAGGHSKRLITLLGSTRSPNRRRAAISPRRVAARYWTKTAAAAGAKFDLSSTGLCFPWRELTRFSTHPLCRPSSRLSEDRERVSSSRCFAKPAGSCEIGRLAE